MGDGTRLGLGDTTRNRTVVSDIGKAKVPSNSTEGSVEWMEQSEWEARAGLSRWMGCGSSEVEAEKLKDAGRMLWREESEF